MSAVTAIPAGSYVIDPTHSRIGFSARHAVITKVRGSFNDFAGTGSIADGQVSLEVVMQADSIDTRQADRDAHLKSEDFFNAAAFPQLKFVSTSVTQTGADEFAVTGELTIKDVTKPLGKAKGIDVSPKKIRGKMNTKGQGCLSATKNV